VAVLGGPGILPGREQEAMLVWQNLRARAAQGDVGASEDLAALTLLLAQHPSLDDRLDMLIALRESAYDAAVLPRHKQEQLGALARAWVIGGDRARAHLYLSWMVSNAPEIEMDSELRLSSAMVATLERDPQRVLAWLGPRKDAIPIVDWMDPMASVLRANAYESMGDMASAKAALDELPSRMVLRAMRKAFPGLDLCPRSAGEWTRALDQAGAQRAAASAGRLTGAIGWTLAGIGLVELVVAAFSAVAVESDPWNGGTQVNAGIGVVLLAVGLLGARAARAQARHAAWLRLHGVALTARIVDAQTTGTTINDVPVFRFVLQVAGPQGPYPASFEKLVPSHEVAALLGAEVRVRANPAKLEEVILEE
jgi:hypothetical protein